jgi:hypothetical protein
MKAMGFGELRLVAPRHFPDPDATAMSAGGADVLSKARVFETLEGALVDCALAVGFQRARARAFASAAGAARSAPEILEATRKAGSRSSSATRPRGLSNEELAAVPALRRDPVQSRVRLAEPRRRRPGRVLRAERGGTRVRRTRIAPSAAPPPSRTSRALFAHLESAAVGSGFLDRKSPAAYGAHAKGSSRACASSARR